MGKQTMNQRIRRLEAERLEEERQEQIAELAKRPLREAADEEWEAEVEKKREQITELLKSTFGREPSSFPPPIGSRVYVEADGLLFGLSYNWSYDSEDYERYLALVVVCPGCNHYYSYRVDGYSDVGRWLKSAEHDARCSKCLEHNRPPTL